MLAPSEQERYSRQIMLPEIGLKGQELLRAAKVLVIGAGGLGCPVLQYLAAAGVGTIGIADGDIVSLSNLQRQLLYTENDIDLPKAETAAAKLRLQNPHITVNAYNTNLDHENAIELISQYDIIVDGTDNFQSRYLINDACVITHKPFVFGSIDRFEGQVSVFNYENGPTYRCLFPEPPAAGMMPNCSEIGVIATLPAIIASLQANEVIKMIMKTGTVLSGSLLMIDTLKMQFQSFDFSAIEANKNITTLPQSTIDCAVPKTISYETLQHWQQDGKDFELIDLREEDAHRRFNIGGKNIPYYELEISFSDLDASKTTVLYCQSGIMSKQWAAWLQLQGFSAIYHLENGIMPLQKN